MVDDGLISFRTFVTCGGQTGTGKLFQFPSAPLHFTDPPSIPEVYNSQHIIFDTALGHIPIKKS
jgi:hypothetical protein